ncbi:MAG: anthranilate synthase component II [Aestuariibacter sp.]
MILLIDNYDSFTYNLARYLRELQCQVEVVRNDQISLAQIELLAPSLLVFSPGPCTPNQSGITLAAIERFKGKIPMLGVCLGHQSIAQVFGATIGRAKHIMHGKVSELTHTGHKMFAGIPATFQVTRYHSLIVQENTLPDCLEVTAQVHTEGFSEIMAFAHRQLPIWGVQFHPESHLTEYGHRLLNNIIELAFGEQRQKTHIDSTMNKQSS